MIKALLLIFFPTTVWEWIAQQKRGYAFILATYLLPIILLVSAVEGWGLRSWGKWQPKYQKLKEFSDNTIITYESIQFALLLAMVLVSALVLLIISQTFETRRTYRQAFTAMAYGFSPLFLARLLDANPMMSPWVSWAIGIVLTIWILYQGVPRVMQPDPTHAFGLYLSAVIVVLLLSGIVRVLTGLYLLGWVDFQHSWLAHKIHRLFP